MDKIKWWFTHPTPSLLGHWNSPTSYKKRMYLPISRQQGERRHDTRRITRVTYLLTKSAITLFRTPIQARTGPCLSLYVYPWSQKTTFLTFLPGWKFLFFFVGLNKARPHKFAWFLPGPLPQASYIQIFAQMAASGIICISIFSQNLRWLLKYRPTCTHTATAV